MPLNERSVYPSSNYMRHASRRSVVHGTNGMVASSQPLASEAGQRILKMGGNAADAAVAVAAALNITEPSSTGIGGDMFCLYFDADSKMVRALNGSGRAPMSTTLQQVREECGLKPGAPGGIPPHSGMAVTVPGAAAGWCDVVEKFGSGNVTLKQILTPAIELGEKGFPVSEIAARLWQQEENKMKDVSPNFREALKKDPKAEQYYRAPRAGEIMQYTALANTFRTLAKEGKRGFYTGRIAQAIIDVVKLTGGFMTLQDLEEHMEYGSQETEAISVKFHGQNVGRGPFPRQDGASSGHAVELWEHPPNGQGMVALMTLELLQMLEKQRKILTFSQDDHNSVPYLHAVIESLKIAFADAHWWISDPDHNDFDFGALLDQNYLEERAKLFDPEKAGSPSYGQAGPSPAHNSCDTVYFAVTDKDGNGISFINSVYTGFGTGIIPEGCGFTLQNRGCNFQLGPENHPNVYAPGKRPYHTIIPAMVTHGHEGDNLELHSVYGVMGGFMQPQGHVQVLLNMEVFGMNPQQALDAPRICIGAGMPDDEKGSVTDSKVYVEEGIEDEVVEGLRKMGHDIEVLYGFARTKFGRGQVIRRHVDELTGIQVFSAGSDLRGDGCAMPA